MTDHNNKKRGPRRVRRCRESISFLDSSILDESNPDKLIQYIRDKRGIRNTAPLFCEPVNTDRNSFPIEIEPIETNSQKSNENNINQQHSVEPDQNGSKTRRSHISLRQSSLHSGTAVRVAVKRLTNNIGRRVLVKEFEKTVMCSNFKPGAASTPNHQEGLLNDFDSIVSNIPYDKEVYDQTINETLRPNSPSLPLANEPSLPMPVEPSVRNATISQEKSIFETAMRRNGEEQLIEKSPAPQQTQFFHESIDTGDGGYEKNPQKTPMNKTRNCTVKNNDQPMDETILNRGDILQSQIEINRSRASLSQNSPRTHHPLSTIKPRAQINRLSMFSTLHPINYARERSLEHTAPVITSASTTPKSHQSVALAKIIDKVKQSMMPVPATPKEPRQNISQSAHDASLTIPPTQSQPTPAGPSQTPVVVIPIYTSCDKNHQENHAKTPLSPAKKENAQLEQIVQTISSTSSPIVITSDNSIASANISRRKQRSKRSTRSHRNREDLMTSDEDVPNNDQNHRDVFRERKSPECDKSKNRSTLEHNQSGVIDLRVRSRRNKKSSCGSVTQKASISRPIDRQQSSAQESTLVETNEIQEIENFLKQLNQSHSVEPTKEQRTSRVRSTASHVENSPMDPMIYTSSSSSSEEEAPFDLDEIIIQPLNGLSTKNNGFIYDMSPQSGKKWIDPVIGNKVNGRKNSTMVRRATQVMSRIDEPPQVNYKDVMSAMQLSQKNKSLGQSRRKLYSKGVSDNEELSEQSAEKSNDSTKYDTSNIKHVAILQKANQNILETQRTKSKKHRVHTKIKSIRYRLAEKEQSDSSSRPKSTLTEDEDHLFKIPQIPAMKSKKSIAPEKFLAKNSISRTSKIQSESNYQSSSSNSSATESSYGSDLSNVRHINRSRKKAEEQTTKAIVSTLPKNTASESNVEIQKIVNSTVELLETRPKTRRAKSQHKSKNEVPVDPGVTDKIDKNAKRSNSSNKKMSANKVSATIESEQLSAIEPNNELVSNNPSNLEMDMITDDAGQTNISVRSTRKLLANEKTTITEKPSSSKKNEQSEKKKNTKKPKPAKKKNSADSFTVKGTDRKKQESVTSAAEGTSSKSATSDTNSTDVDTTSSLRRSNRTRRAPIAYWTSNRELDHYDVCYISKNVQKRTKKKKRTASTKPPEQLESIAEQSFDSNISSKELTDNLFDALKEISMTKRPLPETIPEESTIDRSSIEAITRSSSVVPSTSKRNRIQSKATKSIYTVNHQDIHTDSGLATDSTTEQNPNKKSFILGWLQNLLESKNILSNPELARILNNSDVQVASGSDLIFRDIDGVQYAYYNSSGSDENYGYMRFNPKSAKRKARTKFYEMKLLNLAGILQLTTEKGTMSLSNGDFATIPKGVQYALANRTNEPSLLFFIKC